MDPRCALPHTCAQVAMKAYKAKAGSDEGADGEEEEEEEEEDE